MFHIVIQRPRLMEAPPSAKEEARWSCTTSHASVRSDMHCMSNRIAPHNARRLGNVGEPMDIQ